MPEDPSALWETVEANPGFQGLEPFEKLDVGRHYLRRLFEQNRTAIESSEETSAYFDSRAKDFEFRIVENHFPGAARSFFPQVAESGRALGRAVNAFDAKNSAKAVTDARDELERMQNLDPADEVEIPVELPPMTDGVPISRPTSFKTTAGERRKVLNDSIDREGARVVDRTNKILESLKVTGEKTPSKALLQFELSEDLGDYMERNKGDKVASLSALILGLGAESAASTAVSAGASFAGAATGGPVGALAAGGAAGGTVEYLHTFQSELIERLDGDLTEEKMKAVLFDPAFQQAVEKKAVERGAIIGATEGVFAAISAGVAGKLLRKAGTKAARIGAGAGAVMGEQLLGAAGGSTGEFLAQLRTEEKIDIKEVQAEGLAELIGAPAATAGMATQIALQSREFSQNQEGDGGTPGGSERPSGGPAASGPSSQRDPAAPGPQETPGAAPPPGAAPSTAAPQPAAPVPTDTAGTGQLVPIPGGRNVTIETARGLLAQAEREAADPGLPEPVREIEALQASEIRSGIEAAGFPALPGPEEKAVPEATPKRRFRVGSRSLPEHPEGIEDVLSFVHEQGGISVPSSKEAKATGKAEFEQALRTRANIPLVYRRIFRPMQRGDSIRDMVDSIDQLAMQAFEANLIDDATADMLFEAIEEAVDSRMRLRRQLAERETEMQNLEKAELDFAAEAFTPSPGANIPIAVTDLKVGDSIVVDGEELSVKSIDGDSVTLRDGARFGIQVVMDDDLLFVEQAEIQPLSNEAGSLLPVQENSVSQRALRQAETDGVLNDDNRQTVADLAQAIARADNAAAVELPHQLEAIQYVNNARDSDAVTPADILDQNLAAASAFEAEDAAKKGRRAEPPAITERVEAIRAQFPQVPNINRTGEGNLFAEPELPFNLSGEEHVETEFVPPDTRTPIERDIENGQEQLFDEFETREQRDEAEITRLSDDKNRQFPKPRKANADTFERFESESAFEQAFNRFVAAGNFKEAREAVRDSDNPAFKNLIRKWMKGAKAGDADAARNLEWIRHVLSGTVPPEVDPTTEGAPATANGSTSSPAPTQAQPAAASPNKPPPPPPPPPPRPQGAQRFNMPALVFLSRQLGAIPEISRRIRARGAFRPSDPRGSVQQNPNIRLNEFLGKLDWQGAARTLAHEIGHFIDFIPAAVRFANLARRLSPLQQTKKEFVDLIDGKSGRFTDQGKEILKQEAVALSTLMRGPFAEDNPYRNASSELYADFLSAVLIDPDVAFDTAPFMSHAFFSSLEAKPEAHEAYNLLNDLLHSDTLHQAMTEAREEERAAALQSVLDTAKDRNRRTKGGRRFLNNIVGNFWSKHVPAGSKRTGSIVKRWWEGAANPKEGDFVKQMEGAEIEAQQRSSALHARLMRDVYHPMDVAGIDHVQFDEYLRMFQIINEDTQALQDLRDNPEEFRGFLKWLSEVSGFSSEDEIDGTAVPDLDDMGASIVGNIQAHGMMDRIHRAAQRVDAPTIAERGLFAFDIARYQWNADGFTPTDAQESLDRLARDLGDQRYGVLEAAASTFHGHLAQIVRDANAIGLFRPKVWKEKIAPNLDNYIPRMVLDYFTGHIDGGVRQRRGSVKNILHAHAAAQAKAMALLERIARQRMMLFTMREARDAGWIDELEVLPPQTKDRTIRTIEKEGRAVRGYFDRGTWRWVAFEDPDVVKFLDAADPGTLRQIVDLARANSELWRLTTTVLSAGFVFWNNTLRQVRETWKTYGLGGVAELFKALPAARNWARAGLGQNFLTDENLALMERGVLMPLGQFAAADMSMNEAELIERVAQGATGIEALSQRGPGNIVGKIERFAPVRFLLNRMISFSGTVEAMPKIGTARLLDNRGLEQWEATRLARQEGIPNIGVAAGKVGAYAGLLSLFYRVHVMGLRRMTEVGTNPRTRGGFWIRSMLTEVGPKLFYAAAAAGTLDALFGGKDDDDENKQVDFQEAYTRIGRWKIAFGDALFVGWVKPDGGYEVPWGHSHVPGDWTPAHIRLPFSETGRTMAPMASFALFNMWPDNPLKSDRPWRDMRDIAQTITFSANPGMEIASNWMQIGNSKPPRDPYSGRDTVPNDEWQSGMWNRVTGLAHDTVSQLPIPMVQRPGRLENESLPDWLQETLKLPAVSSIIALDNNTLASDSAERIEERDKVNREARKMRGKQTTDAVKLLFRLRDIPADKRTDRETAQIQVLGQWYSSAYLGTESAPGMFKILQLAADGNEQVDAESAADILEATAKTALEQARFLAR